MESGKGFTFLLLFLPKDTFAIIPLAQHDLKAFFSFLNPAWKVAVPIAFYQAASPVRFQKMLKSVLPSARVYTSVRRCN